MVHVFHQAAPLCGVFLFLFFSGHVLKLFAFFTLRVAMEQIRKAIPSFHFYKNIQTLTNDGHMNIFVSQRTWFPDIFANVL